MKKLLGLCLVVLAVNVAVAETDYIAKPLVDAIIAGQQTLTDVTIADDLVVGDAVTVGGAAVVTGALTAGTVGISEGYFDVVNTTQLVFIASTITNVIDADITN